MLKYKTEKKNVITAKVSGYQSQNGALSVWSYYILYGVLRQNITEPVKLTNDKASQHSDAQCDGKGKGLDASLFGRLHASVSNGREDVFHSERETRILVRTRGRHVSSPSNPKIWDKAAKSKQLLRTPFRIGRNILVLHILGSDLSRPA